MLGWPQRVPDENPIRDIKHMEKLQDIEESLYRLFNSDEEVTSDNNYSYEKE